MKQTVALTFDDGPSEWTPRFLDLLARHGARATFFVLASRIADHAPTMERIRLEGHEIALHGWDHAPLDECDDFDLLQQISVAHEHVTKLTGVAPRLWRSPWLLTPPKARALVLATGMEICDPDLDGRDASADQWKIRRNLGIGLRRHRNPVVLLHDGSAPNGERPHGSREPTLKALASFLPRVRSVTASELLGVTA